MSDTPRTEAALILQQAQYVDEQGRRCTCYAVVDANFARQLERELAEAKKPPPCEHPQRSGWVKGAESEMRCDHCGVKVEPNVFVGAPWWPK